ncbi:ROK family protein [Virgibacillus sp. NKC19-3]|uniref:ROK family protein n=1 Tax=Virgibacillus saliphilus TaxID=2831674 RepID=UPI001C9B4D5D|nr:ROK family protein [Virgibacillus sp. NKC19-3]MBY7142277.1 ROK family protein [Virgibacillus sp. NKC19-3]
MDHYLAIDIGGTETKYGILNELGDIVEFGKFSSQNADGSIVLEGIKEIAHEKYNGVKGLAISAPGFIDAASGYIENGGAFRDFDNFNMKSYLENELSMPVTIENDVNCVAYAEKWLGNAQENTDFVCITIGTGVGGALFLNNQLYRGASNRAGEFGHMVHRNKAENTRKSSYNYTSTMRALCMQFATAKKIPLHEVSGELLFQSFDDGDQDAKAIVSDFYESIAKMIYNIFNAINPGKLLIGGGISSRPSLVSELKSQLRKYGLHNDLLEVDTCHFKNQAGIVGATYHHVQNTDF